MERPVSGITKIAKAIRGDKPTSLVSRPSMAG